jgi:opacity protein-like surface antigen
MKGLSVFLAAALGFAVISLQAGEAVAYKQITPQPPSLYGTGFYGAIDMGANVFQDRGDTRTFTERFDGSIFDTVTIDPKNDVGFFGGIKLGYVFGTGVVRPTVEGDFFYNGFSGDADFNLIEVLDCHRVNPHCLAPPIFLGSRNANVTSWINTGAFMGNFILRFAFGRFQPYAGAGLGFYYAESAQIEIKTPTHVFTSGAENHADFAWQVLAGTDYFWTPKFSTFIEYHYLNYTSSRIDPGEDRDLGQHLVGAGLRFHF